MIVTGYAPGALRGGHPCRAASRSSRALYVRTFGESALAFKADWNSSSSSSTRFRLQLLLYGRCIGVDYIALRSFSNDKLLFPLITMECAAGYGQRFGGYSCSEDNSSKISIYVLPSRSCRRSRCEYKYLRDNPSSMCLLVFTDGTMFCPTCTGSHARFIHR